MALCRALLPGLETCCLLPTLWPPDVLGPIYATKFANIVVRLIGDDFCASVIIDLITRRGFLSTFLEKYFEVKLDK